MIKTRYLHRLPAACAAAVLLATACAMAAAVSARAEDRGRWGDIATPAKGPARVHGFYAHGCIAGAARLPRDGPGFAVLRLRRNRYWGHPRLIAFVAELARRVRRGGEVLLIADIAQPRGGPVEGHASHQVGLDADIRLAVVPRTTVTAGYRAEPPHVSMLTPDRKALDRARWSARQAALIEAAARDPRVDRIFVHPVIKRALCRTTRRDRGWLRKVVPWYGHHAHMHVRLYCPATSPGCIKQRPVPRGTGCGGALAWWFTEAPYKPRKPRRPRRRPPLPKACAGVLAR